VNPAEAVEAVDEDLGAILRKSESPGTTVPPSRQKTTTLWRLIQHNRSN